MEFIYFYFKIILGYINLIISVYFRPLETIIFFIYFFLYFLFFIFSWILDESCSFNCNFVLKKNFILFSPCCSLYLYYLSIIRFYIFFFRLFSSFFFSLENLGPWIFDNSYIFFLFSILVMIFSANILEIIFSLLLFIFLLFFYNLIDYYITKLYWYWNIIFDRLCIFFRNLLFPLPLFLSYFWGRYPCYYWDFLGLYKIIVPIIKILIIYIFNIFENILQKYIDTNRILKKKKKIFKQEKL
jgi:hypothetical protein